MGVIDYNESVTLSRILHTVMSVPIHNQSVTNRTNVTSYLDTFNNMTSYLKINGLNNTSKRVPVTSTFQSLWTTPSDPDVVTGYPVERPGSESSVLSKITALLFITAVVLVISYRFVIRLFMGYADRKDDVIPDGLSDEEEDSGVIKPVPDSNIDL